jgi:hypothetical protein
VGMMRSIQVKSKLGPRQNLKATSNPILHDASSIYLSLKNRHSRKFSQE